MVARSIEELKGQHVRLERARIRLSNRDKTLFDDCSNATKNDKKEQAVIYANEIVEVRKLVKFVTYTQIAIERVIIRLETLKELSDIIIDLKPALKGLRIVASRIMNYMPEIGGELNKLSEGIQETLDASRIDLPVAPSVLKVQTHEAQEILNEVSDFLEEKISGQLPEPPSSVKVEKQKAVREMVALTATCSQEILEEKDSSHVVSRKNMEVKELSITFQKTHLEDMLFDYVKKNSGNLDLTECAKELNIPFDNLKQALESLGEKGKVEIRA